MECQTIERYDENHNPIFKPKRKFESLELAIKYAKKINSLEHTIHKVVAYKCKKCCKYHIGRNGKEITVKEKNKLNKF
jgi:hypothetical protein